MQGPERQPKTENKKDGAEKSRIESLTPNDMAVI